MSESTQNAGKISKVSSLNDIDTEVADILANNAKLQQFESSTSSSSSSSPKSDSIENEITRKKLSDEIKQINNENNKLETFNGLKNNVEPFKLADKINELEKERSSVTQSQQQFQQQFINKQQSMLGMKSENISNIGMSATRSNNVINNIDSYKNRHIEPRLTNVIISRDDSIEDSPNSPISSSNLIRPNITYVKSLAGLLRLVLILFYLACWISLASTKKSLHLGRLNKTELESFVDNTNLLGYTDEIRSPFLFFAVTGFTGSIALFLIVTFNMHKYYHKLPWILITLVTNLIWLLPVLILSILSAVAESDLYILNKNLFELYKYDLFKYNFNTGAYASAAAFGFLCTMILMVDSALHALRLKENLTISYP